MPDNVDDKAIEYDADQCMPAGKTIPVDFFNYGNIGPGPLKIKFQNKFFASI